MCILAADTKRVGKYISINGDFAHLVGTVNL